MAKKAKAKKKTSSRHHRVQVINDSLIVAGVGASAGGLESIQKFFEYMPEESGIAFVVVQHLDPHHESIMQEILSRRTPMKVTQAVDGTLVKADHIYLIPPNALLAIQDGILKVVKSGGDIDRRNPIDKFFNSLAQDQGKSSVAIVLSGSGSDGSVGVQRVKEAGGLTIAQSAESAAYDSMPKSAIATGMVDYDMNPEEMPDFLMNYIRYREKDMMDEIPEEVMEDLDAFLRKVCEVLKERFNHDFSLYKKTTLLRRIQRRMQMRRVDSDTEYLRILRRNKDEVEQLFKDFLIGVTYFFRDRDFYHYLEDKVIPSLISHKKSSEILRLWVAGCSTGEEAYSIAIIVKEVLENFSSSLRVQIFATDIDRHSIEIARHGKYPEGITKQVSEKRLRKYFQREGTGYEVSKEIREMCLFSVHDLTRDPPFAKLDLISCRNVMIYMSNELQNKLIRIFHYALKPDGYLVLGPTESVSQPDLFRVIDKKCKVFQSKVALNKSPVSFALNLPLNRALIPGGEGERKFNMSKANEFVEYVGHIVLSKYGPAHVVINENHEIQFFSDGLEGILTPSKGLPSANVIQMAKKSMRVELRSAILHAIKEKKKIQRADVLVTSGAETEQLQITVEPMPESQYSENLYLVIFQRTPQTEGRPKAAEVQRKDKKIESEVISSLEEELHRTKGQLQATIEELELTNEELKSSNEELLSMNEELQSTNEELQTSQEEMQSVNEEWETVNSELNSKIVQVDQANSDLTNLFESIQIATLFLDNKLQIKKFTPEAKALFRIIDTDLQRPITDLAAKFSGIDLEHELLEVIRTLHVRETTVELETTGQRFRVRMHPYRTVKNVIDGAVVTFYDVTALKRAENELVDRLQQQTEIATLGLKALKDTKSLQELFDETVKIIAETLKADFCKVLEYHPEENNLSLVACVGWREGLVGEASVGADLDSQAGYTLKSARPVIVRDMRTEERFSGPALLTEHGVVSGMSVIIQGSDRHPFGVLGVHTRSRRKFVDNDVQFIQAVANILSTAIERHRFGRHRNRLASIVESSQDIIISKTLDGVILSWNPAAEKTYGYSAEEVIGKNIADVIIPSDKLKEVEGKYEILWRGEAVPPFETERVKKNGEKIPVLVTLAPIFEDGKIVAISTVGRDISVQKRYESALIQAKESATSANELKSRFLGILSHELRTPLSSVIGYTELCLETEELSTQAKTYLEKVKNNGELIHRLLGDLVDISKIESGKVKVEKKWVDPRVELQHVYSSLGAGAREKQLSFGIEWKGKIPRRVYTDPVRLRQILVNLISNSIKYTETGKIDVRGEFRIVHDNEADFILRISDTGEGISAEKQKSLFEPFYRANPGLDKPGVGLGLYLSRQLARLLGGEITLESSAVDQGSVFSIYLPVEIDMGDAPDPSTEEEFELSMATLAGVSVLVAEDVADLRELVKAYLQSTGAKVDFAEDGKLALVKAVENKYDIIIVDLVMPNLGGEEVLRGLRDAGNISTPVVALTAQATSDDRRRCLEAGFSAYISKPVTKETLVKTILRNLQGPDS